MVARPSWLQYGACYERRCCRYFPSSLLLIPPIYSMRRGSSAMSVQIGEQFPDRVLLYGKKSISSLPSSTTQRSSKNVSLCRDQPIQLELALQVHAEYIPDPLSVLVRHCQHRSSLDVTLDFDMLSKFLSWVSLQAIRLKQINISLIGRLQKILPVAYNNPFSSSPITETTLQRVPYSYLPIDMASLQRFGLHSYDPLEVHTIIQHSQPLTEFIITLAGPPRPFNINSSHQRSYTLKCITRLFDSSHLSLYGKIRQYQILALQTEQLAAILPGALEPVEYSRITNLFRRSECSLIELTFLVPVPVNSFLLILRQSPAL
ncbi:hypothetical protein EV421DRAFT_2041488 [Armillaria borealis]|uniref:Uncharacterized protein n=1 Tax=Armillaria borealis TaxID=47425 RepID=A0AA39MEP1_9AGAR|nr:hypothetical protein EV421DRAFT_2041488 [Armillaria borealis]